MPTDQPVPLSDEGATMDEQLQRLYGTTDAAVWAEEWCKTARKIRAEGGELIDEGWMIGWFANAIETAKNLVDAH